MAEAGSACRGRDLYQRATQAVFGRGPARAPVVLAVERRVMRGTGRVSDLHTVAAALGAH